MISVAIMAHPKRAAFVEELQGQLPEAEVVWDREDNRWETGARSLAAFDPRARFHMVVQDDAVLCRDLVKGAEKAAVAAGERPVALYTGRTRLQRGMTSAVLRARRMGRPWVATRGPLWGVGVIVPTCFIPELVGWGNAHTTIANYDGRMERWFWTEHQIECWYTVPSLVDHRQVMENPSLVEGRTGNRTAAWFIGKDSPLDIDWTREPVRP